MCEKGGDRSLFTSEPSFPRAVSPVGVRVELSQMASKACLMRLQKEYQRLAKEPLPDVVAEPKCVC